MKILLTLAACLWAVVTVQAQSTWLGNSTSWNSSGNWVGGTPSSTKSAIIPVVSSGLYPVISTNAACLDLTVASGASVTISSNRLEAYGTISNSGTITINGGTATTQGLIDRGALTNATGATINLNGRLACQANLTNNGALASGDEGLLDFTNTSNNTIAGSGTWTLADVSFSNSAGSTFDSGMPGTWPVQIRRLANVRAGNVNFNGKVWLTSDASATSGMLYNVPGITMGTVSGSVRVERAIDSRFNAGAGYRHYASPVAGVTVANLDDFTAAGFTATVQSGYAYPGPVTGNVYSYDQSYVTTTNNDFRYGWKSPTLSTALTPGTAVTVNIGASQKVSLAGIPNTGDVVVGGLGRNNSNTNSGWHLLGNPYPGPLDIFAAMNDNLYNASTNPNGFEGSIAVFHSTGGMGSPFGGRYSPIAINDDPTDSTGQYLSCMQGFMIQKAVAGGSGTFTFNNAQRLNYYPDYSLMPFYRAVPAATTTATYRLRLTNLSAQVYDQTRVAFRPGTTPGHDLRDDVLRPADNEGLYPTLYTVNAVGEACLTNALPAPAASLTLPLGLRTLQPGTAYELRADKLLNLPADTRVYLEDRELGRTTVLSGRGSYTFTAQAAVYPHRFFLRFEPAAAIAQPATEAVAVYPNPAPAAQILHLSASKVSGTTATATLYNTLGQAVGTREVPVRDGLLNGELTTEGLPVGIYTLRLHTAAGVSTQRVVLR